MMHINNFLSLGQFQTLIFRHFQGICLLPVYYRKSLICSAIVLLYIGIMIFVILLPDFTTVQTERVQTVRRDSGRQSSSPSSLSVKPPTTTPFSSHTVRTSSFAAASTFFNVFYSLHSSFLNSVPLPKQYNMIASSLLFQIFTSSC